MLSTLQEPRPSYAGGLNLALEERLLVINI